MPTVPRTVKVTCPECGKQFEPKKQQIEKQKLILAEGLDAHAFLFHATRAFQKLDVQVFNFEGKDQLRLFIQNLATMENFSKVNTLVIARDAETNVESAIQSVQSALKNAANVNLPIPAQPFQFTSANGIKTALILFPGPGPNGRCRTGMIEDLCLETVAHDPVLETCVNSFLECARQNQQGNDKLKHPSKSKLHAYLAAKNDHAGKKLGVAAMAQVWNWDHPAMGHFKKIIQEM